MRIPPARLNPLYVSLGLSVVIHAGMFGMAITYLPTSQGPTLPGDDTPVVLTLVNVPEPLAEPAEEPVKVVEIVAPAPTPPPRPIETVVQELPPPNETIPLPVSVPSTIPPTPAVAPVKPPAIEPMPPPASSRAKPIVRAMPSYRSNPEPVYPAAARRRHQEGTVVLTVKVAASGKPVEIRLKQSSGHTILDNAALEAVCEWNFEPARIDTIPVESEIEVPVQFKLSN